MSDTQKRVVEDRRRGRPGATQTPSGGAAERMRAMLLWSLLAVALWAPLPFGSARPWAAAVLSIALGLIVLGQGAVDLTRPEPGTINFRSVTLAAILFALALAWAVIQCLPIVPSSWHHPLWAEARSLISASTRPAIGLDAGATRSALLHLLTGAAVFWLSFRTAHHPERARTILAGVAAIGAIYAGWGLLVYGTGNGKVLWFEKWAYTDDLTSTFVNRNSFATFAGLALVTSLGLLLDSILSRIDIRQDHRIVLRSLIDVLSTRAAWLIVAIALTFTAVLLTHSRGGAFATAMGVVVLLIMILSAPGLRGWARGGFIVAAGAGMLAMLLISGATTLGRIAGMAWDVEGRNRIYELTLEGIGNTPLLGTGLGSFRWVFPTYRTEDLPFTIEFAHNDYLETMLELGIPAALVLIASLILLAGHCFRGVFVRRRNAVMPCIGAGASVLVGVHACFDFSLQIPAVSLSYLLLLGVGVAQSTPTRVHLDPAVT